MRTCSQCGAADREIAIPGTDKADPNASFHFVRPEIRYLRPSEAFTAKLKRQGWTERAFQGRPTLVRMMCMDCLNANDLRDKVWGELREEARRLERTTNEAAEYYQMLCR